MKNIIIFFTILLFILQQVKSADDPCKPDQIHISLSDVFTSDPTTNNTIKAIFQTKEECPSAYISLKDSEGNIQKIQATAVNFFTESYKPSAWTNKKGTYSTYVHVFDFQSLEFSQSYEYTCYGSDQDQDGFLSKVSQGPFKFNVPNPNYDGNETKVIMFADMDHSPEGMVTINRLTKLAKDNTNGISAFVHNGDLGYNLVSDAGKRGEAFMNTVQKYTAIMPHMVSAGNHEDYNNFSNFNMRFQMPFYEKSQNHYYSYNIGNMHFTSFNLDLPLYQPETKQAMLDWLEQDLIQANKSRDKQPWIIVYTHRPLYCSVPGDEDCTINHKRFSEFDDLISKYNVDLLHAGHVHAYERMLPIKNGKGASFQRMPEDKNLRYIINPQGPVHILQGMAGHRGDLGNAGGYQGGPLTVKVDRRYSFLSVKSANSTHLLVENVQSDKGTVNDYFYIVRSDDEMYSKIAFNERVTEFYFYGNSNSAWKTSTSLFGIIIMCLSFMFI